MILILYIDIVMKNRHLILFILFISSFIVISYFFFDRQVVWFLVRHHSRDLGLLKIFANSITYVISIFVFIFYFYFLIKIMTKSVNRLDKSLLIVSNAIIIGQFLKEVFKTIFGRYWAATFTCNNPSLISSHVYGFNWFKSGSAFASFPSGHATFIFSFSVSMFLVFPKLRWIWVLLAILVTVGQIGMYYHYVSDVLAGALLGGLVGLFAVKYKVNS